jgi:hypothetical protein
MLPALASVQDFQTWTGLDESEVDEARALAILHAASTLVRTHTGRVWVDVDEDDAEVPEEGVSATKLQAAREVVVMVADRVYHNPRGTTQEAAGPFSRSVAAWAALGLELTANEKAMIGGSSGGIPGLGSLRVAAPIDAAGVSRRWWLEDVDC